MNSKKLFSFFSVGICALAAMFAIGVNAASANVTGDLPGGAGSPVFYIAAFSDPQTTPCDGTPDGGETLYAEHDSVSGDAIYNDDNDYTLAFTDADATTYVYFCNKTTGDTLADIVIDHDEGAANHIVDLGMVIGSGLHADLNNDYVIVCDGATKLTTENKQIVASAYVQFFAMDDEDLDYLATMVYFVDDAADDCTFDEDMSTGKTITTTISSPDNYGIYTTFAPDTKAVGDMHADLDAAQMFLDNENGHNIGLGIESYTRAGAPDGGVGDDDYTLYYDKPLSGDMELSIISTANGTTTVAGIDKDSFTAGYDFVNDVTDSGTGVPDDIAVITTTMDVGADTVVFKTTLHDTWLYDLYTDIGGAAQTIVFEKPASTTVFQVDIDSSAEGDDTIDVGKVSGSAHADMSTGGDDLFEVFSDATCATEVSAVDAFGATGAYEVYFEDTGGAGFYIKTTQDSGGTDYDSCGNYFTLANQEATKDLERKITVVLPTAAIGAYTADTVLIDFDKGGTWTAATDVWSRDIEAGTAILYTINSPDGDDNIVVADDGDADPTNGLGTTLLTRTKDFSVADLALDVGGAEGDTHGDLNDEAGDRVSVYSDNACTTTLVSSATVAPAVASNPDYGIFYEADGGLTNYYAKFVDASGATVCVKFGGDAGADTVLSPEYKLTTTLTAGDDATGDQINSIAIDNDKDGDWDAFANNADAAGTNVAYSVDDADSNVYAYYDTDATGTIVLLKTTGVDLSADETVDIAAISGDLDDDFIDATASGAVVDDAAGLIAVYTDWDNNDIPTGLSNSHYVVNEAAIDTYAVYLDVTAGAIAIGGADIKVKDQNDLVSWTMDRDDGGSTIAAGESVDIDLVIKVSGDTPVGTDHINLVSNAAVATHLAAGVTDATGFYAIYTIAHDPLAGNTIQGIAQEPKAVMADTNAVLIRDLTAVATPLADATYDVAMFSGTNHADLDAGTVIVYSGVDCTTAVSSETVNPAAGVWAQYFQGSDSTTYYTKIQTVAGGFATCRTIGDDLAGNTQEVSAINFERKIGGTVKDTSDGGTDVLSAAAMITGAANNYFSNTVDGGATTYQMYIDSTLAGAGDTVRFYSAASAGGTLLLELTKDLTADTTVGVSAAYGETHADIEGGSNLVNAVCDDHSASNVTCTTKYSSEPQTPADVGGADYEIFFEQQVGTTYYLEVLDDDTETYYSWNMFTSGAAGAYTAVNLSGKLSGSISEAYDVTGATKVPDVTIKMYDDGGDPETNQVSLTYSYRDAIDPVADPSGNYRMYGTTGTDYDADYIKDAYITQTDNANVLSVVQDINLVTGVKIVVREFNSGNLITNATISLYACTGATADTCGVVLDTCTQPEGPCTRTGDGTAGNGLSGEYYFSGIPTGDYIQIKVNKHSYTTIMDPNPVEPTNATYQISATTVQPDGLTTASTYFLMPAAIVPDVTPPTVEQFYPANGSATASVSTAIVLLFNELMDITTFTAANVELYKTSGGPAIGISEIFGSPYFTIGGVPKTELVVYPAADLEYGEEYTLTVTADVTDASGNPFVPLLAGDYKFTTAAQVMGSLGIDYPIIVIKQTGTPDNSYANGFEWVMRVTLPTNLPNLSLQFANWTNGLNAANNMQYYSEQILAGSGSAGTPVNIATASTYPANVLVGIDADPTRDGIQTDIHIKLKIPVATPAGAHNTTFKVRAQ